MKPVDFQLEGMTIIAENFHWEFGVGKVGGRWVGFALGVPLQEEPRFMNLFLRISEGIEMGRADRDDAIRRTSALIADDPDMRFGAPQLWFIDASQRGDPDDYRCAECGEVLCDECGEGEL